MEDQNKSTSDLTMEKILHDEKYSKLMDAMDVARSILDEMKDLEKTNLKDLTEAVAERLNASITTVAPFVQIAVQTYQGITVSRGRYGGIFKGIKVKKEDSRKRCDSCGHVIREKKNKADETLLSSGPDENDEDIDLDDEEENEDREDFNSKT